MPIDHRLLDPRGNFSFSANTNLNNLNSMSPSDSYSTINKAPKISLSNSPLEPGDPIIASPLSSLYEQHQFLFDVPVNLIPYFRSFYLESLVDLVFGEGFSRGEWPLGCGSDAVNGSTTGDDCFPGSGPPTTERDDVFHENSTNSTSCHKHKPPLCCDFL